MQAIEYFLEKQRSCKRKRVYVSEASKEATKAKKLALLQFIPNNKTEKSVAII